MLFRSKIHAICALFILVFIILSFSGNHPAGNTGAPGDSICSTCHSGGGGFDGSIDIAGVPSVVDPSQTYNITMTLSVSTGNPILGGFQVVALQDANNNNAGDWFNNGPGSSLIPFNGREYFGHSPAQSFGGGSDIDWTADWIPPDIDGDVTFYFVGNLANGSGSSSGDKIITNTFTVTVDGADPLSVTIGNVIDVSCFDGEDGGATAMASGGMPPYEFLWDNGVANATVSNLDAGFHDVTVTDDDGNTGSETVFIDEPSQIEIDPEIEGVSCFDEDDGFADLNPFGGAGNYDCNWSGNVGQGCVQNGLEAGLYFVTITDNNNCSVVEEIEITRPDPLMINMSSTDETSPGTMDGTATAEPTGGTPPYIFEWSNDVNDAGTSSTITGLSAGLYSVDITDSNGCEISGSVMVDAGACDLMVAPEVMDVACNGDSTGSIDLNIDGGLMPFTINWSNGSDTEIISDIPAGMYAATITDAAGCIIVVNSLMVGQPDTLVANLIQLKDASCDDTADGRIIINISGGTGMYDLVWSNGVTNDTQVVMMDTLIDIPDTLTGLLPGMYSFVLSDSLDCMITDTFNIINSDTIAPTLVLKQGMVYLDSMGMTGPADFDIVDAGSFDNCGIDSVSFMTPSFSCDDIMSHDFPVTLFDAAGNETSGTATVMVVDTIAPIIDCSAIGDITTNTCDTIGYPLPEATDNCTVEFFELVTGQAPGTRFPSGTTVVTYRATDECGNSSECSFSVTVEIDLAVMVDTIIPVSCFGEADASIEVSASGGTPPYDFQVDGGSFENLAPGTYNITVSDQGDCTAITTAIIEQAEMPQEYAIPVTPVSCNGAADGQASLDDLPDSVSWEFDGDPTMLEAGTYEVTITEAGTGCSHVQTFSIASPDPLAVIILAVNNALCHDSEDCSVDFLTNGGTGQVMGELTFTGNECDGGATLLLTDENGCTVEETIEFEAPQPITLVDVDVESEIENESGGSIDVTFNGGTGELAFLWTDDNGNVVGTEEDISELSAGMYHILVTDENGCIASFSFMVDFIDGVVDQQVADQFMSIHPNPAVDVARIDIKKPGVRHLRIYDSKGVTFLNTRPANATDRMTIDLSGWPAGIYLVRLDFGDQVVVSKLVKSAN